MPDYQQHERFGVHYLRPTSYTQRVINKTTKLYISDSEADKKIAKRHRESICCQVTKIVEQERNKFVHATGKVFEHKHNRG